MDKKTTRDVSEIMRKVKSRDTQPEVVLRKALWAKGLRYRLYASDLPGKPDIVLPSKKLAIFIDGDFWHGHQWKSRKLSSLEGQFKVTENREYWITKIQNNERRDLVNTQRLLSDGWRVLRFWESQIRKDLESCVGKILEAVGNNDKTFASYMTFAEFFAGIGLMRMGLEKQGWKIAFANDIDELKYEMYKGNFNDAEKHFLLGDIHDIQADRVPTVTLATASFPCNDLSLAGARCGLSGKQSSAYWGVIKILQDMGSRKPPLILLENVTGLLSSHKGNDFKNTLLALNNLGYVVDAFIINAADFVPQSRVRLFVVGILKEEEENFGSVCEQQGFYESAVRPKALAEFILINPEINWCIRPLPAPQKQNVALKDILEDLPDDAPEWWSKERADYLLNQMSERHLKVVREMIKGNGWSFATAFRRIRKNKSMAEVRNDGIAGCLRTPRGGSGRQILVKAGNGKFFARLLTPRECSRLMGADEYKITAPLNQALFGFGDAVCVPVIEWIAKHYLNPVVAEIMRGHLLKLPTECVNL